MTAAQERPARVVDLHTHLFNARHLPLESIIAGAMGAWSSPLARPLAKLLYFLTDTGGEQAEFSRLQQLHPQRLLHGHGGHEQIDYIASISNVASHELLAGTAAAPLDADGLAALAVDSPEAQAIRGSELMAILRELDQAIPATGGPEPGAWPPVDSLVQEMMAPAGLVDWARRTVKRALERFMAMVVRDPTSTIGNYAEFFFTLLGSEETIFRRLQAAYGSSLPPMEYAHLMMDMELAYPGGPLANYHLPQRTRNMLELQARFPALHGFFAFDPRRNDAKAGGWRQLLTSALEAGFVGFKFYPAMGYRPAGDAVHARRIDEFYDFCLEHDAPIFAHCTPVGFQTPRKEGAFANPEYWAEVLGSRKELRLCLGHAGGQRAPSERPVSAGWDAEEVEWKKGNYAWQVVDLCVRYPNVYCEIGHLEGLLDGDIAAFERNLRRARDTQVEYGFMSKIAYGSDWHMQAMVNSARPYLDLFLQLFEKEEWRDYREGFFWRNAYAYLRLPR
ncbi:MULTISPECIES: amidohydrolase family protein [unclassified Stenotrophomonas]|uniref:amidohydrolase family protein n=1 Tax=unclassified Stenotrophomonas TaxID=196198 RepID=UPI0015E7425A|nr:MULTISPECIES: amidohydrolase family protein [unclassified Stenotrophomonas]